MTSLSSVGIINPFILHGQGSGGRQCPALNSTAQHQTGLFRPAQKHARNICKHENYRRHFEISK